MGVEVGSLMQPRVKLPALDVQGAGSEREDELVGYEVLGGQYVPLQVQVVVVSRERISAKLKYNKIRYK